MKPVTMVIVGAGSRGKAYAGYAQQHPGQLQIVAVAEPRKAYREAFADHYSLPPERVFSDWQQLLDVDRLADTAAICTQDELHKAPAMGLAEKGYHLLLEKPMSPVFDECRDIFEAVQANNVMLSVCHVLRYTKYTRYLKELLGSGVIGNLYSIQHLEPVGFWHQAHSFVRGNWGREQDSCSMLMSKACHDLDWLRYLVGESCELLSSFGKLSHFRRENKPEGSSDRCLDCSLADECAYSAQNIYLTNMFKPLDEENSTENLFAGGSFRQWPWNVLTPEPARKSILEALRTGTYGRCVYDCDNDVVDHQVVNMQFVSGVTVSLTMTAFTPMSDRKTRLFGSKGMIEGDGRVLRCYDFLTRTETVYDTDVLEDSSAAGGHGGGDYELVKAFVQAVAENDASKILSGPKETLESHTMVFAAEQARRESCVVKLDSFLK